MSGLLDRSLPGSCAGCRATGRWPLCATCVDRVAVITPPWCERCGRPTEEPVEACADCPPRALALARAPFVYDGPIGAAIRGMKFSGWHGLAPHLAGAMAELMTGMEVDGVTWVPLSRRRLARRGFDQAAVLARPLAERLGLTARPLLHRARSTRAQARMSGPERRRALAGAFRVTADPLARVLLVDDVLTTGSTAAACAEALLDAGASRVMLLTAARSIGGPIPSRCRQGGGVPPGGRTIDGGLAPGSVVAREEVSW